MVVILVSLEPTPKRGGGGAGGGGGTPKKRTPIGPYTSQCKLPFAMVSAQGPTPPHPHAHFREIDQTINMKTWQDAFHQLKCMSALLKVVELHNRMFPHTTHIICEPHNSPSLSRDQGLQMAKSLFGFGWFLKKNDG